MKTKTTLVFLHVCGGVVGSRAMREVICGGRIRQSVDDDVGLGV